ncbi:MAG: precorrin-6A reductase [Clostridiales Family XIII bacterium]|jgi:precorrin-2 dehydrogenase/sirohydrochlorin ferrochelatase/precorrin-6A/cobalt-precorrin-6A reductase|nr:precorrin-6A reductase [Clostridiales Family XIII bacterium]
MAEIFIFGGTVEGRRLAGRLAGAGIPVRLFTATEYGRDLLPKASFGAAAFVVEAGRLSRIAMAARFAGDAPPLVIDCTHPYAEEVSENLRAACADTGHAYLRVGRAPSEEALPGFSGFGTAEEAAAFLCRQEGGVLLTTGSKTAGAFALPGLTDRVFLRMLPMADNIKKCTALGFDAHRFILMQGPFSYEMNRAMIKDTGVRWLVTKESGGAGGFAEKVAAAMDEGIGLVVIGRPPEPADAVSEDAAFARAAGAADMTGVLAAIARGAEGRGKDGFFPLFSRVRGKTFLVVGGGKVALRRVRTLLGFDCRIRVRAPKIAPEIRALGAAASDEGQLALERCAWDEASLAGVDYATAATDEAAVNRAVAEACRRRGIPVSIADDPGGSDWFFPAVVRDGPVVIGLTSGGEDHRRVADTAARLRRMLAEGEGK